MSRWEELELALEAVERCLVDEDLEGARAAVRHAAEVAGDDDAEVLYARACIAWQEQGPAAAAPALRAAVRADPSHADAHYGLAQLAELEGDRASLVEHFLRVQALDARADRRARLGTGAELDHIEAVAREVIDALPSPFSERLEHVPVILERRPSRDLVRSGFDPRSLGLFEGAPDGDTDTMAPTRIVLFVNNLLAEFPERAELEAQIEITLLHEIGHYFNLDEDDMHRLGLD
ncbi:MAG: metallopeptidase family protein [Myxococcales bacterium]|jgi:predicted Zn-dependent protease with MMP-like domain